MLLEAILLFLWHLFKYPALRASCYRFFGYRRFEAIFDRCFVRTESGIYVLCPADTMPNDRIVLLQGGNVLMALRPYGENWMLVGECFVYGAMYGDFWDQDRCELLWIE